MEFGHDAVSADTLLDEQACYDFLLQVLHPDGLVCPHGHPLPPNQAPHDRHRAPIMDYRCRSCGAVFNLFTNTLWSKTRYRCSSIVHILRGIAQAPQLSIWQPNWALIAGISWNADMPSKPCWPAGFPPQLFT
jgi:hypothetical protein